MVRNKGPRNRGGRAGRIMARKEKRANNHSKYILIGDTLVLKPQWRDEKGKELEVSNKSNLIRKRN